MKYIKTSISSKLVALLAGAALFGLVSQSALAVGTASGTVISNTATLSYSVSGVAQTGITSAASTFTVDNKVNLTVGTPVNLTTVPGTTKQALAYTVTNLGNTTQRYALTANAGAATIVTMSNVAIYLDVNGNGIWDAGDTAYVDASTFGDVVAGGTLKVLIIADTPAGATNGQTALFNLQAQTVNAGTTVVTTATAGANTAGVDVVFADTAGSIDAVTDGKHSASATYSIGSSILSVTKTVTVLCDPFNGSTNPKNIPGAVVQYAITITNAATAASSATLTSVTDALAGSLAWEPKLISGAGAGAACTSATGVQLSATTGFAAVGATGTTTSPYAAPGLAAQATTAGATATAGAGGTVSINYATLASPTLVIAGGVLPVNSVVTVYFNAIVQ